APIPLRQPERRPGPAEEPGPPLAPRLVVPLLALFLRRLPAHIPGLVPPAAPARRGVGPRAFNAIAGVVSRLVRAGRPGPLRLAVPGRAPPRHVLLAQQRVLQRRVGHAGDEDAAAAAGRRRAGQEVLGTHGPA